MDGVVLVVRAGKTALDQARRARHSLSESGARVLGVVLNDVDVTRYLYGYGYGYGYLPEKKSNGSRKSEPPRAASAG